MMGRDAEQFWRVTPDTTAGGAASGPRAGELDAPRRADAGRAHAGVARRRGPPAGADPAGRPRGRRPPALAARSRGAARRQPPQRCAKPFRCSRPWGSSWCGSAAASMWRRPTLRAPPWRFADRCSPRDVYEARWGSRATRRASPRRGSTGRVPRGSRRRSTPWRRRWSGATFPPWRRRTPRFHDLVVELAANPVLVGHGRAHARHDGGEPAPADGPPRPARRDPGRTSRHRGQAGGRGCEWCGARHADAHQGDGGPVWGGDRLRLVRFSRLFQTFDQRCEGHP